MSLPKEKLGIEEFIKLQGGAINWTKHNPDKYAVSEGDLQDVNCLWKVISANREIWSIFSTFASGNFKGEEDDELFVKETDEGIRNRLKKYNAGGKLGFNRICDIITSLALEGLLTEVRHGDGPFTFRYKSELIKTCVLTTGNALEMKVYERMSPQMDECMIGVYIDWDGVIHEQFHEDVTNEIDVLGIKDGVPTFVSCKCGKLDGKEVLYALYELDTVARRFGGDNPNKKLVIINDISDIYKERAQQMGIEIVMM